MSLLKANSVQIGQSATATQNFTLSVPSSPDGTIKLARGNSGATTADILSINASGVITGSTFSGATITSSTVNGGTITLGTAITTTSGTAIDFTGIPSWAKKVTVTLSGVSTSGASNIEIRLGTSSGIEATGYGGTVFVAQSTSVGNSNISTGFLVDATTTSTDSRSGTCILSSQGNTVWAGFGVFGLTNYSRYSSFSGTKQVSGVLDRVRVATVNGTDTFDAGTINIMYEG
jgi:hypothetical protein